MRIIFFCLLFPLIIGGCYPADISNIDDKQLSDFSTYDGKWISNNYQVVQMDGYTAGFGSELYLTYKNDGRLDIRMYDISAPPASRIASIETDTKLLPDGKGSFSFEDDGWGAYGSGIIKLVEDQVVIVIESKTEGDNHPDWRIYSGERVFIRE